MPGIHDSLGAVGIRLVREEDLPGLSAECAGLARRLRELRIRTLGLAPADNGVAIPAVALHLGRALAGASVRPVAVVDATGCWAGDPREAAALPGDERAPPVTSWLGDQLAFLTPRIAVHVGAPRLLGALLESEAAAFDHHVVDLTGFEPAGEQLAACELMDAVLLVARCGATTTRRIRRRLRDLKGSRCLGVLLTGA